jgi:hypothetical protein
MVRKTSAGSKLGPVLRWSSLVLALALVLSLVVLTSGVEAVRPHSPIAPDAVDGPPPLGHTFYGTVKNTQGASIPNGTSVMAKAASGPWTGNVTTKVGADTSAGSYFLTVPGDDPGTTAVEGAIASEPIILYVGGAKAKLYDVAQSKWVESYPWSSGSSTNLALQVDVYYTITASAGPGGSINPAGSVSVPLGGSKTFTMTADPGFALADVVVDSASVGPVNPYTFSNVTTNHTITATFQTTAGSVGGFVFLDMNGNGTRDAEETSGLSGVTITLNVPGGGTQTTVTAGGEGAYAFVSLQPGPYTVVQTQPLGYTSTSPDTVAVNVTAGNQAVADFGEQAFTPTPSPTPTVSPTPDRKLKLYLPLVTR